MPAKRTSLDPERLKKLASGLDADYEYIGVFLALRPAEVGTANAMANAMNSEAD
jgi:hypothetical protein